MTLNTIKALLAARGVAQVRAHWIGGHLQTMTFWTADNKAVIPMPKPGYNGDFIGDVNTHYVARELEALPHKPDATLVLTTGPVEAYVHRGYDIVLD